MPDKRRIITSAEPIVNIYDGIINLAANALDAHADQIGLHRERLLCIRAAAEIALQSGDPIMMRVALEEILKEAKA